MSNGHCPLSPCPHPNTVCNCCHPKLPKLSKPLNSASHPKASRHFRLYHAIYLWIIGVQDHYGIDDVLYSQTFSKDIRTIFEWDISLQHYVFRPLPGSPYDDDDGDDGDRDDDHGQWQVSAYWGRLPCERLLSFEPGFLSWGWRGWWRWGLFFERNSFSLLNILTAPDGQLLHTTTTHTSFYLNVPNFITLNDRERDQKFLWLFRLEVG